MQTHDKAGTPFFKVCFLWSSLLWVAPGLAEDMPDAGDYAFGWTIAPAASADFYEVMLPLEVYQSSADANLRDIGVYNSAGRPVPRTIAQPADDRPVVEERSPLKLLPLYRGQSRQPPDLKVMVQKNLEQTTVTLNAYDPPTDARETDAALDAYVIDIRRAEQPINRLEFSWPESAEAFIGHMDVHASRDLATWQLVGSGGIASLRQDDSRIDRRGIEIDAGDHDFLRLTWRGVPADWILTAAAGVSRTRGADTMRQFLVLNSTGRDADDGGFLFDTNGRILVDQITLLLPEDNTTVRASVYARTGEDREWRKIHNGLFYHLRGGGNAVKSDPVGIARRRTAAWKVVVDRGPAELDVKLELGWRPDKLVLVAQGSGPYQLVAGRAADETEGFPQERTLAESAILDLTRDSDHVVLTGLGPRIELGGPNQLSLAFRPDWRRWLIWIGLSAGVLLVGFMAISLVRQLKSA